MKIFTKKTIILTPIIILCAVYFNLLIVCVSNSGNFNPEKSDCIIVLGYSMEDDFKPSEYLTYRLETALDLYNKGYADYIIVTGGEGPTDDIPVSLSMKKWFLDNDVPSENIFLETKAKNTYENFAFSKEICDENNFDDIIVVTNDFHMYRSMIMSKEFFEAPTGQEAITPMSFHKIISYLKEPLSLIKYEFLLKNTSDTILENNIIYIKNNHFDKMCYTNKNISSINYYIEMVA